MAPASAAQGDWLVRLRGIWVGPQDDSSAVLPTFPGAGVHVDDAIVPELDFTYFLTDHLGAELILATSPHDIFGEGTLAPVGKLADVMALPPTLTLQYHFFSQEIVSPYIGVGVNYSVFYNETDGAVDEVDVENAWGYAFQGGVDFQIPKSRWVVNLDAKKIFLSPNAKVNGGDIESDNFDLDPWVFGVGFGYRF